MTTKGEEYWLLAAATPEQGREATYSLLKSRLANNKMIVFSSVFETPLNMKFGRLDDLVRLADDIVKQDSFVEQVCRRLERMGLDIDPNTEYKIIWQRHALTPEQYLSRFLWDEAKYPKTRTLRQNLDVIVQSVSRLDEEVRVKAALYQEVKSSSASTSKAEMLGFGARDFTDIFTPDICNAKDFIDTEHLETVVAVVPKAEASSFPSYYWKVDDKVVPHSHKHYPPVDKDGATLCTFVVFKSALEAVRERLRERKVILRQFQYSESAYKLKVEERGKLEAELSKQESTLARICVAALSECLVAWVHLKAIRIFAESVLRYGVPPQFSSFIIRLSPKVKEARVRKELEEIFGTKSYLGQGYFSGQGGGKKDATDAEGEDFYPYVSLTFTPFVQFVQK